MIRMSTFSSWSESSQARLQEMDHAVTNEVLLGLVLSRLPSSYLPLTTVLDTIDDLTYDMLKGRVRSFYQRSILGCSATTDSTVVKVLLSRSQGSDKAVGPCFACDEYGHLAKDCVARNHSKWRSKRKKWKHADESNGDKKRVDLALSAIHADSSPGCKGGNLKIDLVVDWEASTHMTSAIALLENVILEHGTVGVAGGRVLSSIGKGTMRLAALTQDGVTCDVTLSNVLIVPDLGSNLLSVSQMTKRGAKVVFDKGNAYIQVGVTEFPIKLSNGLRLWKCEAPKLSGHM